MACQQGFPQSVIPEITYPAGMCQHCQIPLCGSSQYAVPPRTKHSHIMGSAFMRTARNVDNGGRRFPFLASFKDVNHRRQKDKSLSSWLQGACLAGLPVVKRKRNRGLFLLAAAPLHLRLLGKKQNQQLAEPFVSTPQDWKINMGHEVRACKRSYSVGCNCDYEALL